MHDNDYGWRRAARWLSTFVDWHVYSNVSFFVIPLPATFQRRFTPRPFFSLIAEKRGRSAAKFWYALSYIFFAQGVKISNPGHLKSGHQITSNDTTSEKAWICAIATMINRLISNFQELVIVTLPTKRISRILYYVSWGQVNFMTYPFLCQQCKWENLTYLSLS